VFVGLGFDVHRFGRDRKLILGGVEIPFDRGLIGHSDADVLTHAICDAILGAAGLKDIGHYFPNNSKEFEGISSLFLLDKVMDLISDKDFFVVNIDSIVAAEEPKIFPYINEMKKNFSRILKIDIERIGIKGTTTEGLGFEGRREGISAHAIAMIEKKTKIF